MTLQHILEIDDVEIESDSFVIDNYILNLDLK